MNWKLTEEIKDYVEKEKEACSMLEDLAEKIKEILSNVTGSDVKQSIVDNYCVELSVQREPAHGVAVENVFYEVLPNIERPEFMCEDLITSKEADELKRILKREM